MKYCIKCGKEIQDDAVFCSACGTQVPHIEPKQTEKTVYDGRLYKCPNCGELLDAFVTVCPICDYELRGTNVTSYVHEFSLKLEKTVDPEQRIELIKNFYIPNTKEDIYEFFILAFSNITVGSYDEEAWLTKLEQTHLKAKLNFGNSEEYTRIKDFYQTINKQSTKKRIFKSKTFKAVLILSIGLFLLLFGFISPSIFKLDDNQSPAFYVMAMFGFVPFLVGLIMFIIPERKKRFRRRK